MGDNNQFSFFYGVPSCGFSLASIELIFGMVSLPEGSGIVSIILFFASNSAKCCPFFLLVFSGVRVFVFSG